MEYAEHGPIIMSKMTVIIQLFNWLLLLTTLGMLILGIGLIITAIKYMRHKMEYEKELLVKVDQLINTQSEKPPKQ